MTVRILQLSDLHMAVTPNRYGLPDVLQQLHAAQGVERLELFASLMRRDSLLGSHSPVLATAVEKWFDANSHDIDAIIVTGDLATTGEMSDLLIAKNWLDELAPFTPVAVMPGNHDRFQGESTLYQPGCSNFDTLFRSWTCGQGVQTLWSGGGVTVIGADLSLQAGDQGDEFLVGHLGRGRVHEETIEALHEQSWPIVQRGDVLLWAIHFEPGCSDETLALLNEELLADELKSNVGHYDTPMPSAIICGHTHQASRVKQFAGVPVLCCGSTMQRSENGNWLNVVEIDGGKVTLRPFRYNEGSGSFVEVL
jgi:3',5'-cyclic AMP phosphodiesterase CpdA